MGLDWYEMIGTIGIIGSIYVWLLFYEHKLAYKLACVGMVWIILLLYVQAVGKFTV